MEDAALTELAWVLWWAELSDDQRECVGAMVDDWRSETD